VVDDQVGAPTWCRTIAEASGQIVAKICSGDLVELDRASGLRGIYNLTGRGSVSWCGFARAIAEATRSRRDGAVPKVTPITTAEYPLPAARPANSVLSNQKLQRTFGITCPNWDHALNLCLADHAG
jgi:dTDP-4-dehydrorhamnose reductase